MMDIAIGMLLFGLFVIIFTAVFCSGAAAKKKERECEDIKASIKELNKINE